MRCSRNRRAAPGYRLNMPSSTRPWLSWLVPMFLGIAACEDPQEPKSNAEARADRVQRRLGIEPWHADFPFKMAKWKVSDNPWYRFSPRQALERIVGKLQGHYSKVSWRESKEFFRRAGPEAVDVLLESMDRGMQARHLADVVQNTVEALGRMGHIDDPRIGAALVRALSHAKASVRNSAMASLVPAGDAESVRAAGRLVWGLEMRAQRDWIRAVRRHLPDPEIEEIYRQLIAERGEGMVLETVVEETVQLAPELAARILAPFWEDARGALRHNIAIVLNNAGDLRGTRYLGDLMLDENADNRAMALRGIGGNIDKLQDRILAASLDPDPGVRQAMISAVVHTPGDNIDEVLVSLTADPDPATRMVAHSALRQRGTRTPVEPLLEDVKVASGTRLAFALADVAAAGHPAGIAAIRDRMLSAPPTERRKFIQALGRSRTPEGFAALREVFLEDEYPIDDRGKQTNVTYVAVLLPNLAESQEAMMELYRALPREDYRRRASVLHALGNVVALSNDEDFRRKVYDEYRALAQNRAELPQMRMLVLQYLQRDLRLEDLTWLKRLQEAEEGPMRKLIVAYLHEFF